MLPIESRGAKNTWKRWLPGRDKTPRDGFADFQGRAPVSFDNERFADRNEERSSSSYMRGSTKRLQRVKMANRKRILGTLLILMYRSCSPGSIAGIELPCGRSRLLGARPAGSSRGSTPHSAGSDIMAIWIGKTTWTCGARRIIPFGSDAGFFGEPSRAQATFGGLRPAKR